MHNCWVPSPAPGKKKKSRHITENQHKKKKYFLSVADKKMGRDGEQGDGGIDWNKEILSH
jgi:hypothetical protein